MDRQKNKFSPEMSKTRVGMRFFFKTIGIGMVSESGIKFQNETKNDVSVNCEFSSLHLLPKV